MSVVVSEAMPWHEGEDKMHRLTKVGNFDSPTSPFLQPRAASMVQRFPLLALGTLDKLGRPWASLWGGEVPLAQPVAKDTIGVRAIVDSKTDPVVEILYEGKDDGEVIHEKGAGRMISGLSINLEQRNRMKLYGRMVAGALNTHEEGLPGSGSVGHVQLVWKIEQTLANCPKYLNCKRIYPSLPEPRLISDSPHLSPEALDLLGKADMFFIASSDHDKDMDSNHRGGPPGFVRVESNAEHGAVLVYPEYSGNNLYQTLGNLQTSPRAGLCFPDFDTGNVLYVTGDTQVLIGKDAAEVLPRSNLAVRLTLTGARFVEKGLAFRGEALERSPYNPTVRYLPSEKAVVGDEKSVMAKLIKKERLTPTIFRVRFAISDPGAFGPWKPGQYAALSFYDELYMGYSHMRDDDPKSLNDDFLRTFTVSSHHGEGLHGEEFEMTIRNVGHVTSFLMRQNERSNLEIPLRGFAGDFFIKQKPEGLTPFIAGGIGITPLISQLLDLDVSRLRLFWTLAVKDIGLVQDTFKRFPALPKSTALFLTGDGSHLPAVEKNKLKQVSDSGAKVEKRRMLVGDLAGLDVEEWYLCTGPALRKMIQGWLPGKKTIYENFDY
jgi:predicted pyridoxine 5'-phosphate oxidase superfamily flavin-nucleotide-binding protein